MREREENYLKMVQRIMEDPEYLGLLPEYRLRERRLYALMDTMPPKHRQIIDDYLTLFYDLHTRMVIHACENKTGSGGA